MSFAFDFPRSCAQVESKAGHGKPGICAHVHWRCTRVCGLALNANTKTGDACDGGDDADWYTSPFENWPLLNMDLDELSDVRTASVPNMRWNPTHQCDRVSEA